MTYSIAIIGRPNVGKSTLFNRLVGRRLALVDDEPGVTRDRREAMAELYGLPFRLLDTAGLEEAAEASLEARMRQQTDRAVAEADLVLFLIDARAGVTPLDAHFASWLRRQNRPIVLLANKCEGSQGDAGEAEAYGLGLGEVIAISAEHGLGMSDLHDAIARHHPDGAAPPEAEEAAAWDSVDLAEESEEAEPQILQMIVIGRPNVGKSTLINRLVGEERLLTGAEAGITRDAIALDWEYKGRPVRLIDTAGIRRKPKVVRGGIEQLSVSDGLRALRYAHVAVLLVDAEAPLEKQDLTIARMVIEEGRALVLAINKWDLAEDRQAVTNKVRDRLERSLPQVKGLPVVTLSALQDRKLDRLLDAVLVAYDNWNQRVATGALNRWLEAVIQSHPPPAPGGRRIRLKYLTQAKARPPTFALFCSLPDALPDSYLRYLENSLRERFDLPGTPLRLQLRKSDNPYADRKKKRGK